MPRPLRGPSGVPQPEMCRGALQHMQRARGLVASSARRNSTRILLGRRRQLVDEALDDEGVARRSDAAPERGRDAGRLLAHVVDEEVRDVVGQVDRAVDRVGVEAVLERRAAQKRAMIDEPTMRWFQATSLPFSSRPALMRS